MLVYASLVVKDEADIIENSIRRALAWADKVFVIDNGSSDGTAGIVRRIDTRVVLLGEFYGPFTRGLRALPFNYVNQTNFYPRPEWWCRMDADEVYHDNPREFLQAVPERFSRVCTNIIEFIDLRNEGGDLLLASNYDSYIPLDWSETRFIRNVRRLRWDNVLAGDPSGVGPVSPKRIRVLHFPFRTSEQINKRISIRKDNREKVGIGWGNSQFKNHRELIDSYERSNRRPNSGQLEFGCTARNFLSSPQARLKNRVKVALYRLGFFR